MKNIHGSYFWQPLMFADGTHDVAHYAMYLVMVQYSIMTDALGLVTRDWWLWSRFADE